ncbi:MULTISPECIES: glucoamylase family protein [Flavobacteriaceae]|uniref:glucoamylase family protein n=1 Tax=Flavobacteriaceae TaxID=49546 RepID=UPI0014924630|nr:MULTISPECIES: glucoamylase family protein [Allomuricauda]MDC6365629.1 glucoamylase family protein [Muricauda sp. AC10]
MRIVLVIFICAMVSLVAGCNGTGTSKKKLVAQNTLGPNSSDEELMDLIQRQTFNYFWEGAEPNSGLARERIHLDSIYPAHDKDIVTIGGSGFGIMAILVGVERDFITRDEALKRFEKITTFLEKAERFHGAWPHWLNPDGTVAPFSTKDNGGDLVETAFLIQGLLTAKAYFNHDNDREQKLAQKIQTLWEGVEWNWYTKGENVLYWHWSPNYKWEMDFPVGGYNEALIMYILAASSPTYPIEKEVYEKGWARDGLIENDTIYYGLQTELNHYEHSNSPVGPLFWAHYSYLGLDPNDLVDQYGNYWDLNKNHALIHYKHAMKNPGGFEGYGQNCWGLTSSYSLKGYAGHRPDDDIGVISPTAALSSFPYTPKESMQFLRFLYQDHDSLIGKYGPFDAFSFEKDWYLPRYLAIDQGPIPVMIENYRSGLFWKLFMSNKDVQQGLQKLGFQSPHLKNNG